MFGRRYEKLLEMISELAFTVSKLEARVTELEFRKAVGVDPEPENRPVDKAQELRDRKFSEGLDNLLAYDGSKQEEAAHGDE
jgi:hypothetical protein